MSSGQARGAAAARFSSGRAASKAPGARSGAKPHGSALSLLPATLPVSRLPPVNVFVNFSDSASVPRAGGSVTSVIIPALFCFF